MSIRKRTAPPAKQQLVTGTAVNMDPPTVSRLLSELATSQDGMARQIGARSSMTIDLAIGANVVNHGLGGKPRGCSVSPTVADVTFAWAMTSADDKQATISVLNVAQPSAGLDFWR